MNTLIPFALLLVGEGHETLNPLFRDLIETGVAVGDANVPLPAPWMADGLDGAAQMAIIKSILSGEINTDEFVRKSAVAPVWTKIHDIDAPKAAEPVKGMDIAFIAYGDFKAVGSKEFLDRVADTNKDGGAGRPLKAEELSKRGIVVAKGDEKREGFGRMVYNLIDKVELRAVGRGYWTETADSVVAASRLDPKFRDDAEFPNQWRPITKKPGAELEYGDPKPYNGAGYYVKVTRLAEPAGAVFVEAHVVFAEPKAWFNGANLLRSKLPPVIQTQARSFRRELAKATP